MSRKQTVFVGDVFTIKGQIAEVIEYISHKKIKIRFEDGFEVYSRSDRIKSGNIRNPFKKTICDIGYTGIGPHSAKSENKVYMVWLNMMNRCYNPKTQKASPTYKDCSVCEDWHNFQNFAEWYISIFIEDKIGWELDKDLAVKGNKIYSPETCIPLPSELNCLLLKGARKRCNTVIGVNWHSRDNCYQAQCNVHNDSVYLGRFDTELEGFNSYKRFKENHVKQQAEKWKDQIDPRAYEALMNYQVEITD